MTTAKSPLIAHVIFRLDVGGLENGLVNLIDGLPSDEFRHAIICIDRSTDFAGRIKRNDVEIVEIRKRPGFDLSALWRLYREIKRLNPEILHTRNLAALDALLPGMLAGVKYRIHGEHGWDVNDLQAQNRKLRWLRKLHSPLISQYVTVSCDLRDYLVEQVRISAHRIRQIYNGVNTDKFSPASNSVVKKGELSPILDGDTVVIGTVGRIEPVKDHMGLASAFIKLIQDNPELASCVRLAIVGDGELHLALLQRLQQAGVDHLCWLPGARNDIADILGCFDIFVQPSQAEGISNTLLEAMASGLPIIATNVGGNPELVKHRENGIIVRPGDVQGLVSAIIEYIENKDQRIADGAESRFRAVNVFSFEKMLGNYLNLYRDALRFGLV